MVPITPKHLANDLNIKASEVRAMLRARYGLAHANRWTWDEKEAKEVKKWLAKSLDKKVGSS
jgi:hypothetical protein